MTDTNVSLLSLMSVNTVNTDASSSKSSTGKTGLPDFGSLLSQPKQTTQISQVSQAADSKVQKVRSEDADSTVKSTADRTDSGRKMVKEAGESVSAKEKISQKLSSAESQDGQEEQVDAQTLLMQITDQLVQLISQELGTDSQQLMEALEQLDLTVGDLLDSSNLANLFSFLGEDTQPLELLVDPDFQNLLTELKTFTEELAQQMGTTVSETVELLMQAMDEPQQNLAQTDVAIQQTEELLPMEEAVVMEETAEPEQVQNMAQQPEQTAFAVAKDVNPETEEVQTENVQVQEETSEAEVLVSTATEESGETESGESEEKQFFDKQDKSLLYEKEDHTTPVFSHSENTVTVTPEGTTVEQTVKVVDLKNLVSEITEYVKLTTTSNQVSSIEMQLNPANLGKVLVEVATQQGEVSAKIYTQTEAAKEAMEANVNVLRDNLEQQGVKVSAVEVTVQSHAFEENLQEDGSKEQQQLAKEMQKENRRINVNLNEMTLDDLQGLMSEEDMVIARMMRDNGNVMNIGA